MNDLFSAFLSPILFFGLIAVFTHALAARWKLFTLPTDEQPGLATLSLRQVLVVFALYLGITQIFVPLAFAEFSKHVNFGENRVEFALIFQFVFILGAILLIYLYCKRQSSLLMRTIFNPESRLKNFCIGALIWIVSLPVVLLVNHVADFFVTQIFGKSDIDQVAVRYLKLALERPAIAVIPLFLVVIVAPFIEEFLFRGILQNWIKKHLGTKAAILIAAFCFALVHFSTSQGVENISLILTLFVLGCYLGLIYERRRSLYASIGLHMTFNVISCVRILLFPEA